MVPPTKTLSRLSLFVLFFAHLASAPLFSGLTPPPRESDPLSPNIGQICAHLLLDAAQASMNLGPALVAPVDVLAPQVERLALLLDTEIAEAAKTEQRLFEEASASSWGFGGALRLYYSMVTPDSVAEHRKRIEIFKKHRAFLTRLRAVLTTVSQIPALAESVGEIKLDEGEAEHPDQDYEVPIGDWFRDRATESATALLRLALADASKLPDDWEHQTQMRLTSLELATGALHSYLSLSKDARKELRNPFRAEFLDHVAARKLDEVQAWAEREFQGPVERDWVVRLTGSLVFQHQYISKRFEHLSWMKQELELSNDAEGREALLAHVEVAFSTGVDLIDVVQRSKEFRAASAESSWAEGFHPRHHAVLAQYSFEYGQSVSQIMLALKAGVSASRTIARETENSPEFRLLVTRSSIEADGVGETFVSSAGKLYRGFDYFHVATSNPAIDAAYIAAMAQMHSKAGSVIEPTELLKHAIEVRRLTVADEHPGGNIDTAYRISDWVRFAIFARVHEMPDELMATMIRRTRGARKMVQPVGRVLGAIQYAMTQQFGTDSPTRAQLSNWTASIEQLSETLYVPLVLTDTPWHRLVIGALEPGFIPPSQDVPTSVASWDVVSDVAPDAYLTARYMQFGPTTILFTGENGPQFRDPRVSSEADVRMGLPIYQPFPRTP